MRMRSKFFLSHHSDYNSSESSRSPSSAKSPSQQTLSETIMDSNIENAEWIIRRWDLDARPAASEAYNSSGQSLFTDGRYEARQFLDSVSDLRTAMHFFVAEGATSPMLVRAHDLTRIAMKRLEKEFFTILKTHKSTVLSPESVSSSHHSRNSSAASRSSDEDDTPGESDLFEFGSVRDSLAAAAEAEDEVSELVMADLRTIADCMISSGYVKECVRIYKIIRKSIIDEAFYKLGIENFSQSQIQKMEWDVLEAKIKKWISAARTAVTIHFHGERVLCDHVFASSNNVRESCFADIFRENALALFSFPENLAKSKKILSPEKMFRFLDMYEALSELWPDVELIFASDSVSTVRSQAGASLVKLGEAVRAMLSQFESAIEKDSSKVAVPGGGIHPLTRYAMNYIVFLADYSGWLADVLADCPPPMQAPLPTSYSSSPASIICGVSEPYSPASAVAVRLAWIILVLLCKLDGKAGLYKDHVALSYLFLANNLNYVVSKVKTSKLVLLVGPDWISTHESKVKRYAENYERIGWAKALAALPEDPFSDIASVHKIREAFRQFNSGFEESYRVQGSWIIPDRNLRDTVKISLSRKMVPIYRVFYEKHGMAAMGDEEESIVRFAPEDLENYLSDLIFSNSDSGGSGSSRKTPNDS